MILDHVLDVLLVELAAADLLQRLRLGLLLGVGLGRGADVHGLRGHQLIVGQRMVGMHPAAELLHRRQVAFCAATSPSEASAALPCTALVRNCWSALLRCFGAAAPSGRRCRQRRDGRSRSANVSWASSVGSTHNRRGPAAFAPGFTKRRGRSRLRASHGAVQNKPFSRPVFCGCRWMIGVSPVWTLWPSAAFSRRRCASFVGSTTMPGSGGLRQNISRSVRLSLG